MEMILMRLHIQHVSALDGRAALTAAAVQAQPTERTSNNRSVSLATPKQQFMETEQRKSAEYRRDRDG